MAVSLDAVDRACRRARLRDRARGGCGVAHLHREARPARRRRSSAPASSAALVSARSRASVVADSVAGAVSSAGQLQSVFVVEDGVAHTRMITTGDDRRGRSRSSPVFAQGEKVVAPAPAGLADGARVEVRP